MVLWVPTGLRGSDLVQLRVEHHLLHKALCRALLPVTFLSFFWRSWELSLQKGCGCRGACINRGMLMCMVGCLKEAVWEMNREFRSLLCLCGCIAAVRLQRLKLGERGGLPPLTDGRALGWGLGSGWLSSWWFSRLSPWRDVRELWASVQGVIFLGVGWGMLFGVGSVEAVFFPFLLNALSLAEMQCVRTVMHEFPRLPGVCPYKTPHL